VARRNGPAVGYAPASAAAAEDRDGADVDAAVAGDDLTFVDDTAENGRDVEQVDAGAGPGGDGASVRYSATGAAATEHGILAEVNAHTREIARRNRAGIADTAREGRDQLDLDATGACCNPAAGGVANAARKDRGVADENAVVGMPSGNRAAVGDAAGKGVVFVTTMALEPAEIVP
jgi:hypothetical protein